MKIVFNEYVMSEDVRLNRKLLPPIFNVVQMQISRVAPIPDSDLTDEPFRPTIPRTLSREHSTFSHRDTGLLRKILQSR